MNIMIIDRNIPIPTPSHRVASSRLPNGHWDYLNEMEVGDSVFDENATTCTSAKSKLYNTLYQLAVKNNWKIRGAKEPTGGVRIWRIK